MLDILAVALLIFPIAFAVLGAIISIKPPRRDTSRRWWFTAFIVLGVLNGAAAFWHQSLTKLGLTREQERSAQERKVAARDQKKQQETIELLRKELREARGLLGEIQKGGERTERRLLEDSQARVKAEQRRRTPPLMDANLVNAERPGEALVTITSRNLIPFECQIVIATASNVIVSGIPVGWSRVIPTEGLSIFRSKKSIRWDQVADDYLELRFNFRSLIPELFDTPGHHGLILKKYRVGAEGTPSLIK